ncbi:phosphatase PAP2 family protein [Amycolatopsis acidiphila]|uniref:Phosphatase PAP2 family protein n=1 Tax=Amycolatopsis acidiphila TaxID=715473 RepID=A0A558A4G9_9PSEU|nr:bifunctional phosphatase PAP2/diacylglycerol kinase family protein [Amycolatopsis acidiphila]TVT19174.1 phosphatase PAP2 family protein [Amycolatopsis acidiphila]UIJ61988.1 phosphatase PAP2 family protein [Amycolatopsis acidiphila]GHG56742.1 glycerophosphatase [Amycolatopsis acidiphila]
MWRRLPAADRWVLRRLGAADTRALSVLPPLGRAANYGRLWWGVSAALAATGNRRARRAGLRGMIALGVASFAANVVSKQAVRRPRPPLELTPVGRRLRRIPVTTSFPSGHSASAAAFATGVALEWPLLAVPVGLLAAGVGASRVVTGAHYPTDVLAGFALGAGAGALTMWWWPRTPAGPADAALVAAPAAPTGEGVIVVVNSAAGSTNGDLVDLLRRRLPDAEIVQPEDGADLAKVLAEAAERGRVLGVAGGDGSINIAAKTAAEHDVPLFVIPAGTLNHFARDLGVENVEEAISAVQAGAASRIDLGCVDEHVFVNTCSTGVYTELVRYREKWEKRLGKWPAVLVGLVHLLRRTQPQNLVIDGRRRRVWMVFAGNGQYLPLGFAPTARPRLDDGLLDVRIVDAERPFARTRVALAVLLGTLRWSGPYEGTAVRELEITAPDGLLYLTLDGEFTSVDPAVRITKQPHALTVYRPR